MFLGAWDGGKESFRHLKIPALGFALSWAPAMLQAGLFLIRESRCLASPYMSARTSFSFTFTHTPAFWAGIIREQFAESSIKQEPAFMLMS